MQTTPLNNPAIETLSDLWVTRYGNEWVELDAVMNDNFYGTAYIALKAAGKLEVHFLTDRARYVCRKAD
jgi:hypothetical protein